MFTFSHLIRWFSQKLAEKKTNEEMMQLIIVSCFLTGLAGCLIFFEYFSPVKAGLADLLSTEGMPLLSLGMATVMFTVREDEKLNRQIEFINLIRDTSGGNLPLCSTNIEDLAISVIQKSLTEEINAPKAKEKSHEENN